MAPKPKPVVWGEIKFDLNLAHPEADVDAVMNDYLVMKGNDTRWYYFVDGVKNTSKDAAVKALSLIIQPPAPAAGAAPAEHVLQPEAGDDAVAVAVAAEVQLEVDAAAAGSGAAQGENVVDEALAPPTGPKRDEAAGQGEPERKRPRVDGPIFGAVDFQAIWQDYNDKLERLVAAKTKCDELQKQLADAVQTFKAMLCPSDAAGPSQRNP